MDLIGALTGWLHRYRAVVVVGMLVYALRRWQRHSCDDCAIDCPEDDRPVSNLCDAWKAE